jgi:hypothetical protein
MLRAYRSALSLRDRLHAWLANLTGTGRKRRAARKPAPRRPALERLETLEAPNSLFNPVSGAGLTALTSVALPALTEAASQQLLAQHVSGTARAWAPAVAPAALPAANVAYARPGQPAAPTARPAQQAADHLFAGGQLHRPLSDDPLTDPLGGTPPRRAGHGYVAPVLPPIMLAA